ncbi:MULTISPECIES: class I SAM-dependent methyltransferase [unclassified Ensifer]|uniref:class I SAM-dependent methyltransferase n=1 Tax=unclassified Ensifer TaxID=2633371 RepID=UPI00081326D3|nr:MULTISPECIES: class I SAM-dependent methyltransferase [unclassified Ensifer]OCP18534.1 SAM-dependent methyltransferase [Ensifer sp. LC54]OCP18671.1 SAM-dependent methyltransferase [Ensifer sp. LC384]
MLLKRLFHWKRIAGAEATETVFDQYCHDIPTAQNAVSALTGWTSQFPPSANVSAGSHPLFADTRIEWALQHAGPMADKRILEIGPLEGMHTYMLNQHDPAVIDAVEANKQCFLRCLVTKEILSINRARFHLGDALKWLEATEAKYDLGIASGVLYHMADPGLFLQLLAARCDQLFLWTHYFSDTAMPAEDVRRLAFSGKSSQRTIEGVPLTYHERRYFQANESKAFCGGMRDRHFWISREDILELLSALGFVDVEIAHDEPAHPGGPCFSIFARRAAPFGT